jgi:hypothetical protein
MTLAKIGLVYAYFDNPQMLRHHLDKWLQYDSSVLRRMQFIIVDDCSQTVAADTVIRDRWGSHRPVDFMVFRVQVNRPWGQDGARNIAMKQTEAMWNLMTDMDHELSPSAALRMNKFVDDYAERGHYYMPGRCRSSGTPYHSHPNTFLFHKQDFWEMGGYDEDFVGYYGSDGNFRKCAKAWGLIEEYIDTWKMVMYEINDIGDCNTRGLTRKEGELWAAKNQYLNQKRTGPGYRAINPHRLPYSRVM